MLVVVNNLPELDIFAVLESCEEVMADDERPLVLVALMDALVERNVLAVVGLGREVEAEVERTALLEARDKV